MNARRHAMLRQTDDVFSPCEVHFFDEIESISAADLVSSDSFPSDDIWKKFELCEFPLTEFTMSRGTDDDLELDAMLEWSLDACGVVRDTSEIRHHDCMWAGHCGSKEHKPDVIKPRPQITSTPVKKTTTNVVQTGRSLLRNVQTPRPTQHPQPVLVTRGTGPRPDSPPSSDDDDHPRFKHEPPMFEQSANKTLQLLNDAISEYEYDSDLYEYFEEGDVCVDADTITKDNATSHGSVVTVTPVTRTAYPCESDHSYHKGKGAQFRTDHLGVQTPSDSEEEIDVVTIGDKQITNVRSCATTLPTNPSIRDRQKLQRTVASAISSKREFINQVGTGCVVGSGIKTRLPLRLAGSGSPPHASTKKRTAASEGRRGAKRARYPRYQKSSPGSSPAKRRGYGHSSDSDTECSEKRSLHNNMERQRRVDLRNAFDDLRVMVPEVSCKERAAKVVILREAAAYCDHLSEESAAYTRQVAELRRQQERLRARVSQLRRSLAAKR